VDKTPFREVFLTVKAPVRPLNSLLISHLVREYMRKAGVAMADRHTITAPDATTPGAIFFRRNALCWSFRASSNFLVLRAPDRAKGLNPLDTSITRVNPPAVRSGNRPLLPFDSPVNPQNWLRDGCRPGE
jgi:hypothetical protein